MAKRLGRDALSWLNEDSEQTKEEASTPQPNLTPAVEPIAEQIAEPVVEQRSKEHNTPIVQEQPAPKASRIKQVEEPPVKKNKKKDWIQGCYHIYPDVLESLHLYRLRTKPIQELSEIVNEALKLYLSERGAYKKR